jgi:hypothetical protein
MKNFNLKSVLVIGMIAGSSALFGQTYTITETTTGTSGNIPKFTGISTIGNSQIVDHGTSITIPTQDVIIGGTAPISGENFSIQKTYNGATFMRIYNDSTGNSVSANYVATALSSGISMSAYGPTYFHSGLGGTMFQANSAVLNGSGTNMNIGTPGSTPLSFWTNNLKRMTINTSGQVLVGSGWQDSNPGNHNTALLQVNGDVVIGTNTSANLWVTQNNWPDFVFDKNYKLTPLDQVEKFYMSNHHLPDVPSLAEIQQNGNNLGQTDVVLLQKIEELTLYIVELKKEIEAMKKDLH